MTPTSSCSIGSGAMPPPTCHRPRLPIAGLFRVTFLATLLLALPSTMIMANGISSTEQQLQLPRHVRCSDDVDDGLLRGYASIKDLNADMIDINNKLVQLKDNNGIDPTTAFTLCPGTVLDAGGDEEPLRPLFPVICPTKDCIVRGGDVQVEILDAVASRRSIRLSGITFLDSKDVSVDVSNTYDGTVELVDCHWKNNTGRASILIDSMTSTADSRVKPNVSVKITSSSITDGYTTIENGDVYRPIFSAHADLSLYDVIIAGNTGGFRRQEGQQQRALPSSFVMNVIGGYAQVTSSTFQYNSHFTAVVRPTRKARLVIRDTKFLDNSHGMATVVALDGSQVSISDNSRFEHNLMATADVLALQGSSVDMSDCIIRSSKSVVAPAVSDDTSNVTTKNVMGSTSSGNPLCQGGTFVVHDDDDESRNVGQCLYGGDGSSNDCHGTCVAFNAPRGAASA